MYKIQSSRKIRFVTETCMEWSLTRDFIKIDFISELHIFYSRNSLMVDNVPFTASENSESTSSSIYHLGILTFWFAGNPLRVMYTHRCNILDQLAPVARDRITIMFRLLARIWSSPSVQEFAARRRRAIQWRAVESRSRTRVSSAYKHPSEPRVNRLRRYIRYRVSKPPAASALGAWRLQVTSWPYRGKYKYVTGRSSSRLVTALS